MYEVISILNPTISTEGIEEKINAWKKIIDDMGGQLDRVARIGKKTLAYEVKKHHQGYLILMHIQGSHEIKDELERQFKISDDVIKYQTVKLSELELKVSRSTVDRFVSTTPSVKSESVDQEQPRDTPETTATQEDKPDDTAKAEAHTEPQETEESDK